jgi:hypothetical protein
MEEIKCLHCGKSFIKKSYQQKFCCNDCKVSYWNKKGDRHKKGYYHKYNKKHPERILRIMPTLSSRDNDNYFAMEQYLNDKDFRKYIKDGSLNADGGECHVDLYTEWQNYVGID